VTSLTGWTRVRASLKRALRELRGKSREAFGFAFAKLVGPKHLATVLDPAEISTVLICRLNGRMGNAMFLTPGIHRLRALLPGASIDLALSYPRAQELFGALPGVRRIIAFPHKSPRLVRRYLAAVRSLRACRYDLVIDPTVESTSGRIALTMSRARYRLGFVNRRQWAPLTHGVPEPPEIHTTHEAARPVLLLSRIFGVPYEPQDVRLWLPLGDGELAQGRRVIANALASDSRQDPANAFGFFAHASSFKVINQAWWIAFWDAFLRLEPQAAPIEFRPSPSHAPTIARFPSVHIPSVRDLTATIAATRVFISSDTGPMHLASSTSVPTVALFHSSSAPLYRPLKASDVALDISQCSAHAVAQRCQQVWRSLALSAVAVSAS